MKTQLRHWLQLLDKRRAVIKPRKFTLSADNPRVEDVRARCIDLIREMDVSKPVEITLCGADKKRTLAQNAFYWAGMVAPICEYTGLTKENQHQELLGKFFGWDTFTVWSEELGEDITVYTPKKRSSKLKKKEMMEYLDWLPRFAAEMGVVISVSE